MTHRTHAFVLMIAWAALAAGCGDAGGDKKGGKPADAKGPDEARARAAFEMFQKALKEKDAEKLWGLIDDDSQADAEREAKAVRDEYAKAGDAGKKEMQKNLGLSGAELETLDGRGFLKTRRFLGKYDEVPGSKIDKVEVKNSSGTVTYIEDDGDKEKFALTGDKGTWRLTVPMPKGKR